MAWVYLVLACENFLLVLKLSVKAERFQSNLAMQVRVLLVERNECCSYRFTSPNERSIDRDWEPSGLLSIGSRLRQGSLFPFLHKLDGIDCFKSNTVSLGLFSFRSSSVAEFMKGRG